ncbi:MAG: GNAT family N-acetyltransferase [Planctomycetes bacterium]|nr:GNAT family N-acetyltransferase [Planctomycetota bacterium]MBL7041580.1 GNAT family N-acetyltransferase [Pirellulaceae bacterium]
MPQEIVCRNAQLDDTSILVEFNRAMALETESKVLDAAMLSQGVTALLENPDLGFYVVAEYDGAVIGALMVTTEWSDWRNGVFWWIQSVYVQPEFRRQGVYRRLYRAVQGMAAEDSKVCGFRLYVAQDNTAAQQVYKTLGMSPTHYWIFEDLI